MSAPESSRTRLQLVSTPVVLVAALLAAAIFLALFPSERMLRDIAERRKSDVLSVAYLRLLLRTHPEDGAVGLALAQAYIQAGEWNKARLILLPLAAQENHQGQSASLALLEISWQRYIGLGARDERRAAAAKDLGVAIGVLAARSVTPATLRRLAELGAALDRPELGAVLYQKLAVQEPAQASHWMELAANARIASGAPAQAAPMLAQLSQAGALSRAARATHASRALQQWLAAGDGAAALRFVDGLLGSDSAPGEYGADAGWLQQGVSIARANSDNERARSWSRRLLALAPDDLARLAQQLDIELARQALPDALLLSRRLVALAPDTARRTQLAQIAGWSNQQALALQQWTTLARQNPAGPAMEQALLLANARAEDGLWLELAGRAARERSLKPAELGAVTALEQRGKVNRELSRFLLAYLDAQQTRQTQATQANHANHANHANQTSEATQSSQVTQQILWSTLTRLQSALGENEAALATWQALQQRGGLGFSPLELAMAQAQLLVRLERPAQATLLLDSVAATVGAGDVAYWTLYGDLAWQLDRRQLAMSAYRRVWDGSAQNSAALPAAAALVAERLIAGYGGEQNAAAAIGIAREAYARMDEARWLLLGMDAAAAAERWYALRSLLEQAGQKPEQFENSDMYWLLYGRSAAQDKRVGEARAAYEKVLARSPALVQARLALLWLDIDHGRLAQLGADLPRWENDALSDSAYWPAYAAGHESLQDYRRALPWLQRLAPRHEKQPFWALHHAEVVAKAGQPEQAQRLRHAVYARLRPQFSHPNSMLTVSLSSSATGARAPEKSLVLAYAKLAQEFSGSAAADRVLLDLLDRGVDDVEVHEMLVASALDDKNPALAAQRLRTAQGRRHRLPVWQSLAVAVAGSDRQAIAMALADSDRNAALATGGGSAGRGAGSNGSGALHGVGTLAPTDKVEAMRILGLNADALKYADETLLGEENAGNALLRKQRESLAQQQATRVRVGAGARRIGPLALSQQEAQVSVALDPVRATVRVAQTRFSSKGGEYGLDGIEHERDFSVSVEGISDALNPLLRLSLGTLQREDRSPMYGRFEWARRLNSRTALHLDTSFNMASEETAALRLFGKKDKFSTGLAVDLSDSVYARVDGAGQRYRSRAGETLGRGYRAAAEVGATVLREAPFWQVRVSGSWEKNRLADTLPADLLGSRLQGAAVIGDVVAERFGLVALGSTLRFGDAQARPGSAWVQADVFAGHEWPARRNAYGARLQFVMPLAAPDELRLEAYYSNAQRGVSAQASRGIGFSYMRPF